MDRSGLRETISTFGKSLPARSSSTGKTSGKSIIVPRISSSANFAIDAHPSTFFDAAFLSYRCKPPANNLLQNWSIFETIHSTTDAPRPRGKPSALPSGGMVLQCAPQSWYGSGQKESAR
jgi:hypothetical protein